MMLVDWLVKHFPTAKRQTLKRMVEDKRVRVNGVVARKLKEEILETDKVTVSDHRSRAAPPEPRSTLPVVYEDDDLLVVHKPHGLLTSTVPREPRPTLLAMVREHVMLTSGPEARVGLIHRLDKDASGLLIFSKNAEAYESLKKQLFEHSIDRIYTAIVEGKPPELRGRIRSFLVELPDGSVRSTKAPGKGQGAMTEYIVLKSGPARSMLRVILHTGRKHQIRVHLSERGTPIVNDPVYGVEKKPKGRLMLEATSIGFVHPTTAKRMAFELPMPEELKEAFE